jgi:hypothetical protein
VLGEHRDDVVEEHQLVPAEHATKAPQVEKGPTAVAILKDHRRDIGDAVTLQQFTPEQAVRGRVEAGGAGQPGPTVDRREVLELDESG